ncbi:hypothetical protein LTR20_008788 [Exophiala xenobiotica]|nr:hypothetical protein LTS13_008679 [Exophiala xenobiotica]KAK5392536.1 hypothetical protein LTR79_010002 [Exophiala xenobiotica]KAK5424317.1 hypothetical protein LTR90_001663 [Exophiala xenobiotica]KAK5437195.1 hypothetical protein LTR18_009057 [Exophiala xenobiotica]KAK5457437.1 hypothetical protein LTR20_008788 [Exophiala xenobiotica]
MLISKVALFLLATITGHVIAESVTKCGNYGDSSYYNSTTLPYVFYNNPWGNDGSGYSCITVNNNGTSFDATWKWRNNSEDVHAYPHFKLDSPLYPLQLGELSSIDFSCTFGVNVTSAYNESQEQRVQSLDDNDVQYNIALDMFLDSNSTNAMGTLPHYEIMIWLSYSWDVYPVGISTSNPDKDQFILGDTRFFLFHGNNTQNQTVFSWLPETNLTAVDADYSPLLHYLWQFGFMPKDIYLGTLQFGTEQFHATNEVLFRAANYSLGLSRNTSEVFADLESVKSVAVPSQVPTMDRFKTSGATKLSGSMSVVISSGCSLALVAFWWL